LIEKIPYIIFRWELLNPDADIGYLPHPKPVDDVAMTFRKLPIK
jgi:ent-kaurenoic acid hydroxylase